MNPCPTVSPTRLRRYQGESISWNTPISLSFFKKYWHVIRFFLSFCLSCSTLVMNTFQSFIRYPPFPLSISCRTLNVLHSSIEPHGSFPWISLENSKHRSLPPLFLPLHNCHVYACVVTPNFFSAPLCCLEIQLSRMEDWCCAKDGNGKRESKENILWSFASIFASGSFPFSSSHEKKTWTM